MTIHRMRLGPDLLQGARDDKPLTLFGIGIMLVSGIVAFGFLGVMVLDLWMALQLRSAQAWSNFWSDTRDIEIIGAYTVIGPLMVGVVDGTRLHERAIRRFALLGDDHWAPALDVQPTPLTPAEQAQNSLDFGAVYGSKANLAIAAIIGGFLMIAAGAGFVWLALWGLQQSWPIPASDRLVVSGFAALVIVFIAGFTAGGIWLVWWGMRLNGGVHLVGDDAALHIYTRRGRERARIAWHEIRALAAQSPATGSDRTTFYLDTGDRVLIWSESLFDPSTVRARHALLRRAVVTGTGVPLRDVTRIYTSVPAMFAQGQSMHLPTDDAVPTETDRVVWAPIRAFVRIVRFLIYCGGALTIVAFLLLLVAFVLQHLLG